MPSTPAAANCSDAQSVGFDECESREAEIPCPCKHGDLGVGAEALGLQNFAKPTVQDAHRRPVDHSIDPELLQAAQPRSSGQVGSFASTPATTGRLPRRGKMCSRSRASVWTLALP